MRKSARALGLVLLALLTSAVLGVASAFMASLALGATVTALIVPGTGTHDANDITGYNANAVSRYLGGTACTEDGNTCKPNAIEYPASFWPLGFIGNWCPGYTCDTWNTSVATGVSTLDQTIKDTDGDIVLFGYSQGGAVVSDELRNLLDDPDSLAKIRDVVMIGNILNPDGGLWNRLGLFPFSQIPIPGLNVTLGPPMITDFPVHITNIGFQYDPVCCSPLYWGNPLALLNALAAFQTVHGNYLTPNENSSELMAYGYTDLELAEQLNESLHPENFRHDSNGNTYVIIPAKSLPLVDVVMGVLPAALLPVAKPVADLISPVLKVLIDLGYDWSGDPGVKRLLSPLPFNPIQNWPAVGVRLLVAAVQGIQAFIGDLGGLTTTIAPTTDEPVSNTPVSTLAAARTSVATSSEETEDVSATEQSTPKLTVVKDHDTAVQQTAVETADDTTAAEDAKAVEDTTAADDASADDDATAADTTAADETNTGDETKADEKANDKKADEAKADEKKVAEKATDEKATEKKASDKKSDNEKSDDTDKKDADSAKAAA